MWLLEKLIKGLYETWMTVLSILFWAFVVVTIYNVIFK